MFASKQFYSPLSKVNPDLVVTLTPSAFPDENSIPIMLLHCLTDVRQPIKIKPSHKRFILMRKQNQISNKCSTWTVQFKFILPFRRYAPAVYLFCLLIIALFIGKQGWTFVKSIFIEFQVLIFKTRNTICTQEAKH